MCPFSTGGGLVFVSCASIHDHPVLEADCSSPKTCPGLVHTSSSKGDSIRFAWCQSGEQAEIRCFIIGVGWKLDGSTVHILVADPNSREKPSTIPDLQVWSEVRRFVECHSYTSFNMSKRGILQVATRKHLTSILSTALLTIGQPWQHASLDDAFELFFNAKHTYTILQQDSRPLSRK